MRGFLKSRDNFIKCLGFVLLFGCISLGAIGGCNTNVGGHPRIDSGPDFVTPRAIAVGSQVVVDSDLKALLRVDPTTGDRVIISAVGTGSGPGFVTPLGIAVEADGNLVVDTDSQAVLRVDPISGNRTIISAARTSSGQ